ncbi:MAG: hypothetical protein ACODAQ_09850 [Phycisphaeraceae bacterium]
MTEPMQAIPGPEQRIQPPRSAPSQESGRKPAKESTPPAAPNTTGDTVELTGTPAKPTVEMTAPLSQELAAMTPQAVGQVAQEAGRQVAAHVASMLESADLDEQQQKKLGDALNRYADRLEELANGDTSDPEKVGDRLNEAQTELMDVLGNVFGEADQPEEADDPAALVARLDEMLTGLRDGLSGAMSDLTNLSEVAEESDDEARGLYQQLLRDQAAALQSQRESDERSQPASAQDGDTTLDVVA